MKQALVSDITNFVNTNTSLNNLTDVLVENNSTYVGNSPSNTNTASNNVGVGTAAMSSVTTGDDNTAVGYNALSAITEGSKNVAVGKDAMSSGTVTGDGNMAVGFNALNNTTSGSGNVAIGRQVFSSLTTGSRNVGIGRMAGIDNDGGSAGTNAITSGDNNTYIGAEADPSSASVTNETVIGYGATGKGQNTVNR